MSLNSLSSRSQLKNANEKTPGLTSDFIESQGSSVYEPERIADLPDEYSDTIFIRDFHIEDYESLVALWQSAQLPYKPKGRDSRSNIESQLKQGNTFLLVAEVNGKLAGSILVTHDSRKGWINRLVVDSEYRRQGLAKRLVAEAENRLYELGINIVAGLIEEWNTDSMKVFERLGYTRGNIAYYSKRKNADV